MNLGKHFKVYHKPADNQRPFSLVVENRSLNEVLFFESGVATTLSLEEFDSLKLFYVKTCEAYALLGVLTYNAGNHRILYLVLVSSYVSVGKLPVGKGAETEILRITGVLAISLRNEAGDEERLVELIKLLSSGIFYLALSTNREVPPLDLTLCAQRAALGAPTDNRFFWNRGLHLYVQSFGISCEKWLVKIICGGVEIKTHYAGQYQARVCIISRFNCYRAGTRFQVRGANDDGNVANFVETEQITCLGDQVASHVQIRGSVPLFWEQTGVQVGAHKIKFSRSFETMSPAFDRHLYMIRREYGDQVIINLLGSKEGETNLTDAFQKLLNASRHHAEVSYIHFDYHANVRGGRPDALVRDLQDKISTRLFEFGFFHCTQEGGILRQQSGTARTNCLDCLDRTNAVQTFIGLMVLNEQLKALGLIDKPQIVSRFQQLFAQIWQQNGDHVSRIYAGTGALDGKSKLKDGARSVSRTLQNNLFDTSKQEAMDILLSGALLNSDLADRARTVLPFSLRQVPAFLLNALFSRANEFTDPMPLTFWVGTWNVNGGKNIKTSFNKERPIDDWLLECAQMSRENGTNYLLSSWDPDKEVDVYAVGFEEIVDLNASNIMAASTSNQRQWCIDIEKVLQKKGHYVLVQSVQLVGVCLFVFIHAKHVPHLRDVATAMVKTGLGGVTGNKGGVAIRFQLYNTSLCFCCSHFAAGQSNVNERNADFVEISNKLQFPADLLPHSHDYVFWCGDFNYRIDMGNDYVRDYIKNENWPALVEGDQLIFSKKDKKCFDDYIEAPVLFAPTYKYDPFSDDYDTSEKCRTPAWTDRVLVRARKYGAESDYNEFSIVYYGRTEIRSSDHRPVNALVEADIRQTNPRYCDDVLDDILSSLGPSDGTVLMSLDDPDSLYDAAVYQAIMCKMAVLGDILLIRYSGVNLCVTYSTGQSALKALEYNGSEILQRRLSVRLRLEDWRSVLDKLVELCKNSATSLCDTGELLLDENELPLEIQYTNPSSSGLNDLEMLTGEEGRDGKEFDGSLVNMVQSELDDFDTASYHSSNSEALVTPPVPTNKSAPPRPPPSSARAVSGRSVPTKEAFDPWASPQDSEQLIGYSTVPTVTPVQQDALSWPDVAPTQLSGFGVNGSANIGQDGSQTVSYIWSAPVPSDPTSKLSSAGAPPPAPPPRRKVGQKLPDALLKMAK